MDFLELEKHAYMQQNIDEVENSQQRQESPKVRFKKKVSRKKDANSQGAQTKAYQVAALAIQIRDLQDENQKLHSQAIKYKTLAKKHEMANKELKGATRMENMLEKDAQIQRF